MRLTIKLFALAMMVAPMGYMSAKTTNVLADSGPAGYCPPAPAWGPTWAPPGSCVEMPWGSLRCLSGTPYGNWEGFVGFTCSGAPVYYGN
jgi:hypothetical protein